MTGEGGGVVWSAFVELAASVAPVVEKRSRFADKPALVLERREIAHAEGPGHIDLRITAAAWRRLRDEWHADPSVLATPGRRDWVELCLRSPDEVHRLEPLIRAAVRANGG